MDPHDELESTRMTIGEHLEELRQRLIRALLGLAVGIGTSFVFGRWILEFLQRPYYRVMGMLGTQGQMVANSPSIGFMTYMKVCTLSGLLLTSPWVFWQIWQFIGAGLYRHERRYVLVAVPFTVILFVGGAMFFLLYVSVPTLLFLLGFNDWLGLQNLIRLEEYISFVTQMMLAFGVCFQLPIVVFLLGKMGLVTTRSLARYRRHVIVMMFILAALLTSPSPVDQILLALPMWGLYELGIFLLWLDARKKPVVDED